MSSFVREKAAAERLSMKAGIGRMMRAKSIPFTVEVDAGQSVTLTWKSGGMKPITYCVLWDAVMREIKKHADKRV